MKRRFTCIIMAASLLMSSPTVLAAQDATSEAKLLPKTLSLLEETVLYNSPNEDDPSGASLAPQDVQTETAENGWFTFYNDQKVWIRIQTSWLGDQWIHIPAKAIGTIIPKNELAFVSGPIALDNTPFRTGYTGVTLPSQNVTVKAWFERPRGAGLRAYLLETAAGDKWLSPYAEFVLEPIIKQDRNLTFTTEGTIFDGPSSYSYSKERPHFQPQTFHVYETYQDFAHVETKDGKKFWVHPQFAQPERTQPIDKTISLPDKTELYEYPNDLSYINGVLAPQDVKAKETYIDAWGNCWYKIQTYAGDAWIRFNENGRVDPKGIQDSDGYIHVLMQKAVLEDGAVHIYGKVKLVRNINIRFDERLSFTYQMLNASGTVIGEGTQEMNYILNGEEQSFQGIVKMDGAAAFQDGYSFRIVSIHYLSDRG